MQALFRSYQERNCRLYELVALGNWVVKVYTITAKPAFGSVEVLQHVKANLSSLLEEAREHHNSAFLIIHEGTDGVWSLLNWWTGKEMLRTKTYFTSFQEKDKMTLLPGGGSMACVWELPVFMHERNAWVKHILKNASSPDFENYYKDILEGPV